jgi:hypothetical protein
VHEPDAALGARISPRAETGAHDAQHNVADLAGSESIQPSHMAEVLQYGPRLNMMGERGLMEMLK